MEAIVLDVGHGNAAIFVDGTSAIVVDAGHGDSVGRTLLDLGVAEIAALVVSHRHHDHASEIPSLLSDEVFMVKRLFLNSDGTRNPESQFEFDLRSAANAAFDRAGTITTAINHTCGADISTGNLSVEVLLPRVDEYMGGLGTISPVTGRVLNANSYSAVVKVGKRKGRSVLLCADHDHAGLRYLIASNPKAIVADAMIYPHHGGRTGAPDEQAFAREFTAAVDPEAVIFSNGRARYANPRPEVVRGVRAARAKPPIRVLCTQISRACSDDVRPAVADRVDGTLPSAGSALGISCSGSLRISLNRESPLIPNGARHLKFVVDMLSGRSICTQSEVQESV